MLKYVLSALLLIPAAALAADTYSDFDHDVKLASLKTFQFAPYAVGDELTDKRMKNAIRESFGRVGLQEVDSNPDVIISYRDSAQQKHRVNAWGGRPGWWGPQNVTVDSYVDGTSVVEFHSAISKDLIWRGRVTGTVTLNSIDRNIKDAMDKLARAFKKDRDRQAK